MTFRHAGYADGCDGPADREGDWSGLLSLADLGGYSNAEVNVSNLDDSARRAAGGRTVARRRPTDRAREYAVAARLPPHGPPASVGGPLRARSTVSG